MCDLDAINASRLALGLPVLNKYAARGQPIVGTSLEYFDFRGLHIAAGAGLTRLGDCVLGAAAAEKLRLHPGDKLMSDPENVLDIAGSYPINMHVAGILAAAGTADDGAVFVDLKTVWLIMGIMHGHQDIAKAAPAADPSLDIESRREKRHGQRSLAALPRGDARQRRQLPRPRRPGDVSRSARSSLCRMIRSRRTFSAGGMSIRKLPCKCSCRGTWSRRRSTWSFA